MCIASSGLIASIYLVLTMCQTVSVFNKVTHFIFTTTLWEGTIIIHCSFFFPRWKNCLRFCHWWGATCPIRSTLTILYHLRNCLGEGMSSQDRMLEFLGPLDVSRLNIIKNLPRTLNRGQLKGKRTQEDKDIIWLIRTKTILSCINWTDFFNSFLTLFWMST